jgi:Zn-dependent protease with chaperone function
MANSKYPNAYAIGARSIVVTTGLLGSVSDEELEGLLAHEVGHIMGGDTVKRTVSYTVNAAGNIASKILLAVLTVMAVLGKAAEEMFVERGGIIALFIGAIALLFKLALKIVQYLLELGMLSVGRSEEYRADTYANSLGFGPGLASFLNRMQYTEKLPQGLWAFLSSTHPPTMERLRRLEMG